MAARNPGPYLNQAPLGFPKYNRWVRRDWLARQAFKESEVNTRVYKTVFETLGWRCPIPIDQKTGRQTVRMRCIQGAYPRGIYRYTRMAKMQFFQASREGWLHKYGLQPGKFR
eukprot:GHVT01021292.1.p1 GENE.GHVT01021292.1~~GHVT01021292.1.p1  ORF type:complete len:113 (+),score=1.53 GHVT01021292.1:149-487(+)